MRFPVLATTAVLALALAGCGTDAASPGSSPTPSGSDGFDTVTGPPQTPPSAGSTPTTPPPVDGSLPPGIEDEPRVRAAVQDATGRAGIVPSDVVVAGYAKVTWNDGSLGCPKKGESYTQMRVEGELLLLRADQRVMSYHAADDGPFEYCATPSDGYTLRAG